MNLMEVDVLVIGGGGTGARAAVEADRAGAKVLLAVKGSFGESGATCYKIVEVAGFNAADKTDDASDSPEVHYQDIVTGGMGLADERLAKVLAEDALNQIPFLESLGMKFEKTDAGKYLQVKGCFASKKRMHIIKDHGHPIVEVLKTEIKRRGISVKENVMITDLIIQDGVCMGAVGIDNDGSFMVIKANSTILATGGAAGLFYQNMYPSDITGDGYAMAYRAGAELANMELMQSGIGTIAPTENLIMDWNWALYPKLRNSKGELFLESYLPSGVTEKQCYDDKGTHWPFSTSDKSMYIDIAVTKEIKAGRAAKHGGVYMDLTGVTEKMVDEMPSSGGRQVWEMTKQYLLENGIDVTKEPLEIATCGHAINGGLRIDENGKTTIAGLYAAGEAAAGPHGADRLGGNMLVTGQVFGARAGIAAAARKGKVNFSEQKISDLQKKMDDIAISQGIHDVLELKKSIQQAMWTDGMNIRSEAGLKHCLEVIKDVKEKIQEGLIIRNPGDLKNALELINLADVGEIVATVARLRKESRGSHYREDFPQKDPDWAKSIIIKKVDGQIHTSTGKLSEM